MERNKTTQVVSVPITPSREVWVVGLPCILERGEPFVEYLWRSEALGLMMVVPDDTDALRGAAACGVIETFAVCLTPHGLMTVQLFQNDPFSDGFLKSLWRECYDDPEGYYGFFSRDEAEQFLRGYAEYCDENG